MGADGPRTMWRTDRIGESMARMLLGGAHSVITVAAGAARHLAWYVSYQAGGQARDDEFARRADGRSRQER